MWLKGISVSITAVSDNQEDWKDKRLKSVLKLGFWKTCECNIYAEWVLIKQVSLDDIWYYYISSKTDWRMRLKMPWFIHTEFICKFNTTIYCSVKKKWKFSSSVLKWHRNIWYQNVTCFRLLMDCILYSVTSLFLIDAFPLHNLINWSKVWWVICKICTVSIFSTPITLCICAQYSFCKCLRTIWNFILSQKKSPERGCMKKFTKYSQVTWISEWHLISVNQKVLRPFISNLLIVHCQKYFYFFLCEKIAHTILLKFKTK